MTHCFRSRLVPLLVFVLFFTGFYSLHGGRITPDGSSPDRFYLLTGDEPHYLLMAHSLAFDGDMDLYNNLRDEDYRAFFNRPVSGYTKTKEWILARVSSRSSLRKEPDSYWNRRALPTQPIGTAAFIAPAYRLGFAWGGRIRYTVALLFHATLAALALVMIELCWRFTGNRPVSVLVAGGVTLSAPLLFYSIPVYPDLPGACLIALSMLMLCRMQDDGADASRLRAVALGICSSALPWVHLRFWPAAIIIAIAALWPTRRWHLSRWVAAAFLVPWIVSLAGLARYYRLLFGTPWPASTAPPFSILIGLRTGWPGLFLDPNEGLLAYLPLALFLLPGLVFLVRGRTRPGIVLVILLATYVGLVGANEGWQGGLSPPLRYWVPVMPLVAAAAAVAVARTTARGARVAALVLGLAGPPVAMWGMLHSKLLYSYHHVVMAHGAWSSLWERLPAFCPEATRWSPVAAVAGAVALGLFAFWIIRNRSPGPADGQNSDVGGV